MGAVGVEFRNYIVGCIVTNSILFYFYPSPFIVILSYPTWYGTPLYSVDPLCTSVSPAAGRARYVSVLLCLYVVTVTVTVSSCTVESLQLGCACVGFSFFLFFCNLDLSVGYWYAGY